MTKHDRRLESNQLLRTSWDTLTRAQQHHHHRRELAAAVASFVSEHGDGKLTELLQLGYLIDPWMGKGSQLAVRSASDHVEAALPCALVIKYDPRNKNQERRTDVRLLTGGTVQLNLDFGRTG